MLIIIILFTMRVILYIKNRYGGGDRPFVPPPLDLTVQYNNSIMSITALVFHQYQ